MSVASHSDPLGHDPLEHARAVLSGAVPPVPARPSATVALLRDGADGLEVYLLRRVRALAFAAGMYVFPGGSVDPADHQDGGGPDLAWAGPPQSWWSGPLSADPAQARALVCAAVRETFEECGVLLAGPSSDEVAADVADAGWEEDRRALEAGERSLSAVLTRRGLVLRADLLAPLAHWITPEQEPKRFDTRFFAAALPAGQRTRHVGGEADDRVWLSPRRALDGDLGLMPPTRAVLTDLARFDDAASALRAERVISPILPRFELRNGELRLAMPPTS